MKRHPIRLPHDMHPHNSIVEWWYFNGHLTDKKGNVYSFMDCLFRVNIEKVQMPYLKNIFKYSSRSGTFMTFAHSAVSDIAKRKNYKDVQNISLLSKDSFSRPLFYAQYINPLESIGRFLVHEMVESAPNVFHLKTDRIDLVLESKKPPMLEGGKGFVTVCGRETFYYSHTHLETYGSIKVGNEWIKVLGKSWMDHQWADEEYSKDKWTWFSVQLENGTDMMCIEYDNGKKKEYLVDILDKKGNATHYSHALFSPGGKILRSKETYAEYPLSWEIDVPDGNIRLEISAILSDQEMIFGAINYWEGPTRIVATIKNKKIKGVGFMELAGYPSDYNFLILEGKEINKKLKNGLSSQFKQFF